MTSILLEQKLFAYRFFNASFLERTRRISEGITKTINPILAALGSPSSIELKDHAIPKMNKKTPIQLLIHVEILNFNF